MDLDVLWQPLSIGAVTARNRIYLPAHGMGLAAEPYGAYLLERARGGVGLIVVHGMPVHPSTAAAGGVEPWSRAWIPEIAKIIGPSRKEGCPILVQLAHLGPAGVSRSDERWGPLWAPSAIPSPVQRVVPKVMDLGDIEELIEGFAASAAHAREGGADGIELHAAHGYLLSAFLSPYWNRREDGYGGDTAGRTRLILEIARAVRACCQDGCTLGLKLNVEEYLGPGGLTPPEALRILQVLHAERLFDYFTIAHADYHSLHRLIPPASSGILSTPLAEICRAARDIVQKQVPILVAGSIRNLDSAAELIGKGCADLVGLARAHIADPALVAKSRGHRQSQIRRCVGANQGCWRRRERGLPVVCTANPTTGREAIWSTSALQRASVAKRALIVGGGPAGLKFAETAALRGHEVTLWERSSVLGGQVRYAARLPDYGHWNVLIDDLEASLSRLPVKICSRKTATAEAVIAFGADFTVIATGASWETSGFSTFRPDRNSIPGFEIAHVIDPLTAIASPVSCGRRVTIIDDNGDYLPIGIARLLAQNGKEVTIVTHEAALGQKLRPTLELPWVYPRMLDAGVRVVGSASVERIEPDRLLLTDIWSREPSELPCDTVIFCMMRRSSNALFQELHGRLGGMLRVGDCLAPREIDDAIFEGFREAVNCD
jgi:2,4-dienoyl-CoA reductase-like NADH-dependent reductase (Old Yellow Enzyme family)